MSLNVTHDDKFVIVDDKTSIKSPEGTVFTFDFASITINVEGNEIRVHRETLKGKTIFGPCTDEKVT